MAEKTVHKHVGPHAVALPHIQILDPDIANFQSATETRHENLTTHKPVSLLYRPLEDQTMGVFLIPPIYAICCRGCNCF